MGLNFEDTLFYQIKICEKTFRTLFEHFYKDLNIGISAVESLALNIIKETPDCCQRDLARIMLKDRAGTGKLANLLQKKGLIKIELKNKNNRPVRILSITQKGEKIIKKTTDIREEINKKIKEKITASQMQNAKKTLQTLRKTIEATIKNKI